MLGIPFSLKVRFGQEDHDQPFNSSKEQVRDIMKTNRHPEYNKPFGARYHDIAVLQIKPIRPTIHVRKICLPQMPINMDDRQNAISANLLGWGAAYKGGPPSRLLHEVHLSIYPQW